jgi:DNA-binding response OmpR family regulator
MKKKVLLVEDTPTILKMAKFRLEQSGFDVIEAQSGEEALELVSKCSPDIILLDYGLPGIDGGEVCRRLKSDQKFKSIPVIIFTATIENFQLVKDVGADDGIMKPYESAELIEIIKKYL